MQNNKLNYNNAIYKQNIRNVIQCEKIAVVIQTAEDDTGDDRINVSSFILIFTLLDKRTKTDRSAF